MKYIALFEQIVECVDLLVKPGGANLTGFVDEVDGEKTALTTCIVPFLDIRFM